MRRRNTRALDSECDGLPVLLRPADRWRGERDNVDPSAGRSEAREEGQGPAQTDNGPARHRAEPGNIPGGSPRRPPQDSRRKRANEQRYAGWGDGIERVVCARAEQFPPETFPVASHAGAATIPATVVARRPDALLLCTFSHHGPHSWPDGALVADGPVMVPATGEASEDSVRSQPE